MSDDEAIIQLVRNHFEALYWSEGEEPAWERFRADFLPDAVLCSAARPAQLRSVHGFIERMETVARKNLLSFEEHTRGMKILRFGSVAVVLASSELLENGTETSHDISGYLLVKSAGRWLIMAHAWDQADEGNSILEELYRERAGA
ncbi:nuclear transport factor 2 family protein [Sinirhodobacter sp. WL0062]|uniref:Nuclear transport factor 2 family protein n=1 Tax=Rhodobacter flavimaris TaxID=2907145 RepID=A0ABS8Z1V7_9RHOB|nr:nuclear transport factor 2 family protein [Sinirhodobacter sp. WL0062]MCE5974942.1 nuclear transport factor 2 family protein [Sinirhodobacter sp. WL0062]